MTAVSVELSTKVVFAGIPPKATEQPATRFAPARVTFVPPPVPPLAPLVPPVPLEMGTHWLRSASSEVCGDTIISTRPSGVMNGVTCRIIPTSW